MTNTPASEAHQDDGYVVRGPRKTDAIGLALCRAFDLRATVPEEMRRALEQLDQIAITV